MLMQSMANPSVNRTPQQLRCWGSLRATRSGAGYFKRYASGFRMSILALCRAAARTIRSFPRKRRTCKSPLAAPEARRNKSFSTQPDGKTFRSRGTSALSALLLLTHNPTVKRTRFQRASYLERWALR